MHVSHASAVRYCLALVFQIVIHELSSSQLHTCAVQDRAQGTVERPHVPTIYRQTRYRVSSTARAEVSASF